MTKLLTLNEHKKIGKILKIIYRRALKKKLEYSTKIDQQKSIENSIIKHVSELKCRLDDIASRDVYDEIGMDFTKLYYGDGELNDEEIWEEIQ